MRTAFFLSTAFLLCCFNNDSFAGQTIRVNVNVNGQQVSGAPWFYNPSPYISANGRYVTFESKADNLVGGDSNKISDIFIRDLWTHKTVWVTAPFNDIQNKNGGVGFNPILGTSFDGRYVSFMASVLNKKANIFLYDRLTHKIEDIAYGYYNSLPIILANNLSYDGRYLAFISKDTNLVTNDTNNLNDVFVYDKLRHKNQLITLNSKGEQTNAGTGFNVLPVISANSRYVLFSSSASNLVDNDTNNAEDIFVHDRILRTTERVNIDKDGKQLNAKQLKFDSIEENVYSSPGNISDDGRYVTFSSNANNLVVGDNNNVTDVFVHDRLTHKNERVIINTTLKNVTGELINFSGSGSSLGKISHDGRYVTVTSSYGGHAFLYDRLKHKSELISVGLDGALGRSSSEQGAVADMSLDGRYITFLSDAGNLVANDTNNAFDVFVRDRLLDTKHHADLAITTTKQSAAVKANEVGTYLYTITNKGPSIINDTTLIHLVAGANAISFKSIQGKCDITTTGTVCHLGKLAAGKKLTVQVAIQSQGSKFTQQVSVNAAPVDSKPNNNQVTLTTPLG